jgi:hypothetical protein
MLKEVEFLRRDDDVYGTERDDEDRCDFSMAPYLEIKIFKDKIRVGRCERGSSGSG